MKLPFTLGLTAKIILPIVFITGFLTGYMAYLSSKIEHQDNLVLESTHQMKQQQYLLTELNNVFTKLQSILLSYRVQRSETQLATLIRYDSEFDSLVHRFETLSLTPHAKTLLSELVLHHDALQSAQNGLLEAIQNHNEPLLHTLFEQWSFAKQRFDARLADFTVYNLKTIEAKVAETRAARSKAKAATEVLILANLLILGLYAIYLHLHFIKPVLEITSVAAQIARQNKRLSVQLDRADEIGDLSRAFNRMTKQLTDSNQHLSEAVSARDDFLSVASHELKTPVTSLQLQLQMTQRAIQGVSENPAMKSSALKAVSASLRQVKRLTALVEDLLDATRIGAGKLDLRKESFDLVELVRGQIEAFHSQSVETESPISLAGLETLTGSWDRFRVEQVIANLLSNALKYAPGQPILVRVFENSGAARISVQDFGPGIPPDRQNSIFERFVRGSTDQRISGLGLGLFIVKHITEAHGGSVNVVSKPGFGAEFIVDLPLPQSLRDPKHSKFSELGTVTLIATVAPANGHGQGEPCVHTLPMA